MPAPLYEQYDLESARTRSNYSDSLRNIERYTKRTSVNTGVLVIFAFLILWAQFDTDRLLMKIHKLELSPAK